MMFQPLNESHPITYPGTVNEVVELLYDDISLRDKVTMAHLTEYELDASVYLVMAKTIRKEFGLYNGNTDLLRSCSSYQGRGIRCVRGPGNGHYQRTLEKSEEKAQPPSRQE